MSKRSEYHQIVDGEWNAIRKRNFFEQCCDCGLVHRRNFRVTKDGALEMQVFRDGRATSGARKHFRFSKDD